MRIKLSTSLILGKNILQQSELGVMHYKSNALRNTI